MILKQRKWTLLFLILIIPLGFYSKFYSGPLENWVNNSLGGTFYVIFWSLLFNLFAPKVKPIRITLLIFTVTCLLEFLQLWHPQILESIRKYFIGRALIGTTFSWLDFVHYFVGFIFALILIKYLRRVEDTAR